MKHRLFKALVIIFPIVALVACTKPKQTTTNNSDITTSIVEPSTQTIENTSIDVESSESTIIEPTSTSNEPTQTTTVEPENSSTESTQTTTDEKFNVSFMVDGNEVDNKKVQKNSTTTLPANPSKNGYRFDNWYIQNTNTIFTSSTVINFDVIVEAKFIQICTITFSSEYSTHSAQVIDEGKKLSNLPTPAHTGYTFEGWYVNSTLKDKFDINEPITTNLTLYAYWKQIDTSSDSLTVSNYGGYTEGAFIEINNVSGYTASNYKAYYKLSTQNSFTKIDSELIRLDNSTIRADFLGLTQGNYTIKIELPELNYSAERPVSVTADDRSGYAHFNYSDGVGAYNNDGSLKANAQVIYVTEETKNSVTAVLGGNTYVGIAAILQNQSKSNNPLVIRIIGTIGAATWKSVSNNKYSKGSTTNAVKGINGTYLPTGADLNEAAIINGGYNELDESKYTKLNNLTNKIKWSSDEFDSYYNMCDIKEAKNVTVEGVGADAGLFQWGFTWKSCTSIEVKNLTFSDYTEDACSFEGPDDSSTIDGFKTGHIWVHNNTFNSGVNYFDVCYEQDKHDGDGATDFKKLAYVTLSYNHYYKNHKTGLVGGSDTQHTACISFHHNFYDQCQTRLPFARQANMHMYNNYYYASTGNNMQIYAGAYALIENCYFENIKNTFIFSNSNGVAAVKSYNNIYKDCSNYSGATIVSDRATAVNNGNVYNKNFDTNSSIFYYDSSKDCSSVEVMYSAEDVPTIIPTIAGAGKLKSIEKTNIYSNATSVVKHTISFNTNGGNAIEAIQVMDSATVSSLPTPKKDNNTFGGWYLDTEIKNAFSTSQAITGDLTLFAKWIENTSSWTTILNETFTTNNTPTNVSSIPSSPGIYYRVVNINNESDMAYSLSTNYASISSNLFSIIDEESTYTTFGYYMFDNSYTSGKVKYTATVYTSSSNSKWSFIHFMDGQNNLSIRSDTNKYLTYVIDGNNDHMNNITSSTLTKNTDYTIVLEIDYTNSVIKITIGNDSVTITDYTPSAITGIMFQTASAARSVYCKNIKIEIA